MARFKVQCGQYGNDDMLKLKLFGTSLSGAALTWYSRLKPRSIADWPTMEKLFRETYGTIEPEEAIKLAIRGLEHRQRLKHHGERFTSMGDLINKVGSYELILKELDDKTNASKGTYIPGKNRTVGALNLQAPTYDPYYQRSEEAHTDQDLEDVGVVELTGNPLAHKLKNLKMTREPITIQSFAWTKPKYESYTYDAKNAHLVFNDLIEARYVRLDHKIPPKEELKDKKYCAFHNVYNHDTKDCVKLRDQLQTWLNSTELKMKTPGSTASLVDIDLFPPVVGMVEVNWADQAEDED
uniref:uncharacterized protein LOC105349391 n=1 Tax=Fragaria vesca subsp. vesca TaxID=101020 RepID=UPI0005CB2C74|nr:PREDICTED: uncharacterized protein LOC105349391 [Fragaria vesca subsp. vesca]